MQTRSITRRLIVSVVLTQLVLTAAIGIFSTFLVRRQLRSSFDAALNGRAMAIAALVRYSEDDPPRLIFDNSMVPPSLESGPPDEFEILRSDGTLLAKSPGWMEQHPAYKAGSHWSIAIAGRDYRVAELKNIQVMDQEGPNTTPDRITVFYAASTREAHEQVKRVAIFISLGSFLLLAIAIAATVWAVRSGLSPLTALVASAGQVTADNWKLNPPEAAQATLELAPLLDAMDRMLAKLQQAFTSQREFVANAAHELKTPIAVLKSTLQLALQRPRTAEEYRKQIQSAIDDVARLEALTHSMLRLARAEQLRGAKRLTELPVIDIAATCEQSADRWRGAAEAKSVRLQVQCAASAEIHGDPDDLELIWNNLLDNAIRYSPAGGEVCINVSRDNGHTRVDVQDQGPGISTADLRNIFDRFHRADPSRARETGGYGLGLAIAKAMVQAYGGAITATSRTGAGTTFSVTLPISG